jgi:hypothetical protein
MKRQFFVTDKTTGQAPNLETIALHEEWARWLIYCDMEGFALGENGRLVLMDECGSYHVCPPDRFEIVWCDKDDYKRKGSTAEPSDIEQELI